MLGDKYQRSADHSVSVPATSVTALGANGERTGATFVNTSDTIIYLQKSAAAAVGTGIPLNANGGSYEINSTNLWLGTLFAIAAAAGGKTLCITEDYLSDVAG